MYRSGSIYQNARRRGALTLLSFMLLIAGCAELPAASLAGGPGRSFTDSLQPLSPPSPDIADTIWTDTKESVTDALLFFSAPARFSLRDWGITGWTLIGTGMTAFTDNGIRNTFAAKEGKALNVMVDAGNFYGTWMPGVAISSGLYITGLAFDEPKIRRAGRHVFQSIVYATAITTITKSLVGRHRPHLEDGPYKLEGPSFKDEYNSFPSGHSTMAFAVSSALAAEIDDPWASVGLYALAGMTALSRLYVDRHWGSDVVFGAVVGTICGHSVVNLHDPAGDEAGLLIIPAVNGITAVWRF